jgi:hypothetical protein
LIQPQSDILGNAVYIFQAPPPASSLTPLYQKLLRHPIRIVRFISWCLAELGSPLSPQFHKRIVRHLRSSFSFTPSLHNQNNMSATLTDTALFASIIIFAIALLIMLFAIAFNCSRPGIYLEDDDQVTSSGPPSYSSSSTIIPMHQVDDPLSKPIQSILPF